jgi:hypothetical protein
VESFELRIKRGIEERRWGIKRGVESSGTLFNLT